MPRSCWFFIVLLGVATWGYHEYALAGLEDPIPEWVFSFVAALLSTGALASALDAVQKRGVAAAIRRAERGLAPEDGKFWVASGALHPLGKPLVSPLGGVECVAYEYEMRRKDSGPSLAAYSGNALTPSVVRGARGETRLCGYPDIDDLDSKRVEGDEAYERAAAHVARTRFEVMRARDIFSSLRELYTDDDGSLDLHYKHEDAPAEVSGMELKEKVVPVGRQVQVLGIWSQRAGGLVNDWQGNTLLKLYQSGKKALPTASLPQRLIGPLLVLAVVHGILWFPFQAKRRQDLGRSMDRICEGARTGALDSLASLTPELAGGTCSDGSSPLIMARNAEVTGLLLEAGADPDAETAEGETALHRALAVSDVERTRLLLEAGADPDLTSRRNGLTPLWIVGSTDDELRRLLLEAGAVDDRVTASEGQPLAEDGPVLDVCRRYLDALLTRNVGVVRSLATEEHAGYWGDEIFEGARMELPTSIESFRGYATGEEPGSSATVTVVGTTERGRSSTRTLQLVRWDAGWRVHRLAIDYALEE